MWQSSEGVMPRRSVESDDLRCCRSGLKLRHVSHLSSLMQLESVASHVIDVSGCFSSLCA